MTRTVTMDGVTCEMDGGTTKPDVARLTARLQWIEPSEAGTRVPAVSAIIRTYNRAHCLGRAIDSVMAQTSPPAELIVVDDGSTDDTRAVVDQWGSDVRYVFQENGGAASAGHRGALEASGDWIAFLDSDDLWLPNYLERMGAAIEATRHQGFVYFGDRRREDERETLWARSGFTINTELDLRTNAADWFLLPLQPMQITATVIRKDAYFRVGGFASWMVCREDTYLLFRLGLAGPACAVAGVGALVKADADQGSRLTVTHGPGSRSYCEHTIWLYKDLLERNPRLDDRHREVLRRRLADAYWLRARLELRERRMGAFVAALSRGYALAPRLGLEKTRQWIGRHARA